MPRPSAHGKYFTQHILRNLDRDFSNYAQSYVVEAYSTPPYNWGELKYYLDTYVSDKDVANRLLNEVAEKMGQEVDCCQYRLRY